MIVFQCERVLRLFRDPQYWKDYEAWRASKSIKRGDMKRYDFSEDNVGDRLTHWLKRVKKMNNEMWRKLDARVNNIAAPRASSPSDDESDLVYDF
jgi:hypothetical protein